ncbi:hypothetical protein LSCM4_06432 [Leishmania orientalis]|uniref:DUF6787 domain-containing protein n=1 Tax=Leishmania orientalis TaxID=2249476 RepID=A0A836GXC4_9TRYP|nr:hypothetical protein LSCM4_06432 [Leishmania orientalis]
MGASHARFAQYTSSSRPLARFPCIPPPPPLSPHPLIILNGTRTSPVCAHFYAVMYDIAAAREHVHRYSQKGPRNSHSALMLARLNLNRIVAPSAGSLLCKARPTLTVPAHQPLRFSRRQCSTRSESKAAAEAEQQATSAAGGAAEAKVASQHPASHGPQRKDWRTRKEVVYVKGVAVKGSLFKLPLAEQFIICLVFSIAGSAAVYLVRPQIRYLCHNGFLGLTDEAGWKNGPWLYRLMYCLIMFPSYSLILFVVGGLFGRRVWFSFMIHKMWSRFLTRRASRRLEYLLDLQHY